MTNEKITILHTNDLHSHINRWPKIANWLENRRRELEQQGHSVLLFDIGDFIDRFDTNTQANWGRNNSKLLSDLKYDAVTIGNNEGLALPHDRLEELYQDRNLNVVLSNFFDQEYKIPKWAIPDVTFETQNNTRILVTGMTANYESTYHLLNWHVKDPIDVLQNYAKNKQNADVFVLLSHLGFPADKNIANNFDVDVIIGAHTHHLIEHGLLQNGSFLAAAGKYGEYIGEITLELNEEKQIINQSARVIKTDRLPEPVAQKKFINSWNESGKKILENKVVAFLPKDLSPLEQSQDFLKILQMYLHTDISMISTGMFLNTLKKGKLTEYDLLEDIPHSINLMKVTFIGKDLRKLLNEIYSQGAYLEDFPIQGSGFRGKVFGKMLINGLDEKNIDDQEYYTIGTVDHYYFLPYFRSIPNFSEVEFDYSFIMREIMAIYYNGKYKK